MPLDSTGSVGPTRHDSLRAIGFWMVEANVKPPRPVRVLVSYEALSQFDPTAIRDLAQAFAHFDKYRGQIDQAASAKFDRGGIEEEKYEGQPLVRLNSDDF